LAEGNMGSDGGIVQGNGCFERWSVDLGAAHPAHKPPSANAWRCGWLGKQQEVFRISRSLGCNGLVLARRVRNIPGRREALHTHSLAWKARPPYRRDARAFPPPSAGPAVQQAGITRQPVRAHPAVLTPKPREEPEGKAPPRLPLRKIRLPPF
jgi:hypothetical protein